MASSIATSVHNGDSREGSLFVFLDWLVLFRECSIGKGESLVNLAPFVERPNRPYFRHSIIQYIRTYVLCVNPIRILIIWQDCFEWVRDVPCRFSRRPSKTYSNRRFTIIATYVVFILLTTNLVMLDRPISPWMLLLPWIVVITLKPLPLLTFSEVISGSSSSGDV